MVLTGGDILAIVVVVGAFIGPLYGLYGFLNRTCSKLNRETGELALKVDRIEKKLDK